MKPGTAVTFVSGGDRTPATVTGVVGTGESTFKIVDLVADGVTFEAVAHALDGSDLYWTMDAEAAVVKPVKAKRKRRTKAKTTGGEAKASADISVARAEGDE